MKNKQYENLTKKEKEIVKKHFKACMKDNTMNCYKEHKNIIEFWEAHKEIDY